jgi:hypothetical protein
MKRTVTFYSLGFLLASLLGINLNTNAVFDQLLHEKTLAQPRVVTYNSQANFDGEDYEEKLTNLGITLHPGTSYAPESKSSPSSLKHCESLVYRTLGSLPKEDASQLKNLTLFFSDDGRRGLGGGSTIILRCQNVTDEELVAVLVHEMGHITDTGVLKGTMEAGDSAFKDGSNPVYEDDPSVAFYGLSFKNESNRLGSALDLDFVSGYAQTDPFEDFAESYAYYILHGNEFRTLAGYNDVLAKKYDFLKKTVFKGKEYDNGDTGKADVLSRQYDVTVLPYEMNKFFVI